MGEVESGWLIVESLIAERLFSCSQLSTMNSRLENDGTDPGTCPRHGCGLAVAPEKEREEKGKDVFFSPKESVMKIDGWVFRRYPFAGHDHERRIDGVRREVYCPRCRFWWRVVRWMTLPYVMWR